MVKKIFYILILFIAMSFTVVHAAYAYSWTVDGENLTRGVGSVKNGAARWIESDEYTGGILILENYRGGQLKISCNGTGLGHTFAIQLIGDNFITVNNGVGIIANAPIVFIGDGTLTINAAVPIGGSGVKYADGDTSDIEDLTFVENTSVTIIPSKGESSKVEEPVEVDSIEEVEEEEEIPVVKNVTDNVGYLLSIAGLVVGLLVVAFIIRKVTKRGI